MHPRVLAAVAAGAMLGASLRYALSLLGSSGTGFPWWTLLVNVSGSALLGVVMHLTDRSGQRTDPGLARPFLATGVAGAYTTYSAFAVETVRLIDSGRQLVALAYVVASVVLSLGAVAAGGHLACTWAGRRADVERQSP